MLRQSVNTSSQTDINSTQTTDAIAYPRTGKRGVPQQFPRRLYTMLQSETSDRTIVENHEIPLIQWSKSGQAFHISDIDLFSSHVLPKYFRTSKFSSFQRNLNLYGFSKVRKGPDMDMYAHPSFIQDRPELLSQLKKCRNGGNAIKKLKQNCAPSGVIKSNNVTTATNRFSTAPPSFLEFSAALSNHMNISISKNDRPDEKTYKTFENDGSSGSRVVSPCHTNFLQGSPYLAGSMVFDRSQASFININDNSLSQVSRNLTVSSSPKQTESSNPPPANQGKLGLLALAVECLAD